MGGLSASWRSRKFRRAAPRRTGAGAEPLAATPLRVSHLLRRSSRSSRKIPSPYTRAAGSQSSVAVGPPVAQQFFSLFDLRWHLGYDPLKADEPAGLAEPVDQHDSVEMLSHSVAVLGDSGGAALWLGVLLWHFQHVALGPSKFCLTLGLTIIVLTGNVVSLREVNLESDPESRVRIRLKIGARNVADDGWCVHPAGITEDLQDRRDAGM